MRATDIKGKRKTWEKNATNLDGATATRLSLTNVTLDDQGSCHPVATNQYGSAMSLDATLAVNVVLISPTVNDQPVSQTNLCRGQRHLHRPRQRQRGA